MSNIKQEAISRKIEAMNLWFTLDADNTIKKDYNEWTAHGTDFNYLPILMMATYFEIHSSIEQMYTTGFVDVLDPMNSLSDILVAGKCFIQIQFNGMSYENEPYSGAYQRVFIVNSIDNVQPAPSDSTEIIRYRISFADVMYFVNSDMRISIMYNLPTEQVIQNIKTILEKGSEVKDDASPFHLFKTYREITEQFPAYYNKEEIFPVAKFGDTDNKYVISGTKYNIEMKVPNMHPLDLIRHYVAHSIDKEQNLRVVHNVITKVGTVHKKTSEAAEQVATFDFADCVFYQNKWGKYVLSSWRQILSTPYVPDGSALFEDVVKVAGKYMTTINGSPTLTFFKLPQYADKYTVSPLKAYSILDCNISTFFNIDEIKNSGGFGAILDVADLSNCTAITEYLPYDMMRSAVGQYMESLTFASEGNAFPKTIGAADFYVKTVNPVTIHAAVGANASRTRVMSYNNGLLRSESFEFPYWRGKIIQQYLKSYRASLKVSGTTDIDIGIPIGLKIIPQDEQGQTGSNNTKGKSKRDDLNRIWIVDSFTHKVKMLPDENGGLECDFETEFTCFSPFGNSAEVTDSDIGKYKNAQASSLVQHQYTPNGGAVSATNWASIPSNDEFLKLKYQNGARANIKQEYLDYVDKMAEKYNVPPDVMKALMAAESSGQANLNHPNGNGTIDYGLMQINSCYLQKDELSSVAGRKLDFVNNWQDNIEAGCIEFSKAMNSAGGDIKGALMVYNQGIGNYKSVQSGVWAYGSNKGTPMSKESIDKKNATLNNYANMLLQSLKP